MGSLVARTPSDELLCQLGRGHGKVLGLQAGAVGSEGVLTLATRSRLLETSEHLTSQSEGLTW